MKKITVLLMALVMAMTALLAGCGGEPDTKGVADGSKNVLRVGTTADFAPFEFQDEKGDEYAGFDMDLVRAVGEEMGCKVEIQNLSFDGLIPALNAGNIDLIVSGMSITPERQERVLFSEPYYQSGLNIVVAKDNTTINKFADLKGKKVAVQIGTTSADYVKGMDGVNVVEFSSSADTFMELRAKGVDAVVNDRPVNEYYIASTGEKNVRIINELVSAEDYGFAMDKKQTELAVKVNDALKKLRENGKYQQIYDKWFTAK